MPETQSRIGHVQHRIVSPCQTSHEESVCIFKGEARSGPKGTIEPGTVTEMLQEVDVDGCKSQPYSEREKGKKESANERVGRENNNKRNRP